MVIATAVVAANDRSSCFDGDFLPTFDDPTNAAVTTSDSWVKPRLVQVGVIESKSRTGPLGLD